jgi:hypothetical protein
MRNTWDTEDADPIKDIKEMIQRIKMADGKQTILPKQIINLLSFCINKEIRN